MPDKDYEIELPSGVRIIVSMIMKNTLVRINQCKLPALPSKIAAGRYTWKDVDQWMLGLGARPIPARERERLRKAGLLGMPEE